MFVRNRTDLRQFKLNLLEVSPQQFLRATNTAFCWKIQYRFRSSSGLPQYQARDPVKKYSAFLVASFFIIVLIL
ncbi:hypothetical protein AVEN_90770-1 [Araneus ventricosus]|uniref:Uncharacterized protein n=1 Tax=Araneus ventricosus TaxID=182803 RepID=A0A4Y2P023_ARAVE|nr:hypothetical protein AVEN_90770-1 [Araneus ventricosus]